MDSRYPYIMDHFATKGWTCSQQASLLFRLPPELRSRIYEAVLLDLSDDRRIIVCHKRTRSGLRGWVPLLLTCRLMRDDVEELCFSLYELYFDVGLVDLPKLHRFFYTREPRQCQIIRRLHLDFVLVDSIAPAFRVLPELTGLRFLTLGFPRRHDCSQRGLLVWKLEEAKEAIGKSVVAMSALQKVQVVATARQRYQGPLMAAGMRNMQKWFEALVAERKNCVLRREGDEVWLTNGILAEDEEVARFNQYAQMKGLEPISCSEFPSPPPSEAVLDEYRRGFWY